MSIWALDKDIAIKQLLLLLEQQFGAQQFIVDSNTDAKAVYLIHREEAQMRAYLSTIAQRSERFSLQLEFPIRNEPISLMESYDDLSLAVTMDILSVHLDLVPVSVSWHHQRV